MPRTPVARSNDDGGHFGVGVLQPKRVANLGVLWRSAQVFGASFIFTIRDRFPPEARRNLVSADPALGRPEDVGRCWEHVPYLTFPSVEQLREAMPLARLVGVEMGERSRPLPGYVHPPQAIYLLGSEVDGITPPVALQCDELVGIPSSFSLNVAAAGTVVLYDRLAKQR
jgi:tRNA G18 (ribose-2'-O)-methylase SpoU